MHVARLDSLSTWHRAHAFAFVEHVAGRARWRSRVQTDSIRLRGARASSGDGGGSCAAAQLVLSPALDGCIIRLPRGANNIMDHIPFQDPR